MVASVRPGAADRAGMAASPLHASPADLFGPLLAEVQLRRLFGDGKTFVDAIPKCPAADIMAAFGHVEPRDDALRAFVADHFVMPAAVRVHQGLPGDDLRRHIASSWPELVRHAGDAAHGSMLHLESAFVVPGGRFAELYYWDSYFTMLGLVRDGHEALARSMTEVFTQLIERHGHVPNGSRTYYLGRSQPPRYFAMAALLPSPDAAVQRRRLAAMMAEHAFWMSGAGSLRAGDHAARVVVMPDGGRLNRYWDDRDTPRDESYAEDVATAAASGRAPSPVFRALRAGAESGWDFSSRWLAERGGLPSIRTQEIVPVDLNALLYGLERAVAQSAEALCEDATADRFRSAARARRATMRRWLWQEDGYFADVDLVTGTRRSGPTAASMVPLFTGVATRAEAAATARTVATDLLAPGGLRTTTVWTGEQWDSPNGWAPLQWFAFRGLRRYGHRRLAGEIARRWTGMVEAEFRRGGAIHEKYDVERGGRGHGGEYVPQVGFGWTNGVTAAFIDLLDECRATAATGRSA